MSNIYIAIADKTFETLEKRQKSYSLDENFYHSRNADDSYNFETYYHYLKRFNSENFDAVKALDTVKHYADKYSFLYEDLIPIFSMEYYPSTKYAGLDTQTSMNLFISLLEYTAAQGLQAVITDIIESSSKMIKAKEFAPKKYFKDMDYRAPGLAEELAQIYNNTQNKNNYSSVINEVAQSLHNKYYDIAFNNLDYPYNQKVFAENSKNYTVDLGINGKLIDALVTSFQQIKLPISDILTMKLSSNHAVVKRKKQYDNAYKFEDLISSIILPIEENEWFNNCIKQNNDYSDIFPMTKLLKDYYDSGIFKLYTEFNEGYSDRNDYYNNSDSHDNSINNSENNVNNINVNFSSGAFQFNMRNGDINEIENAIRTSIIPSIFDDYARLKGYF